MTKSYRIRTQPGLDKNIRINVNQDFDFLEILSLKLKQDDVYTRFCSDYGVVAGRVIVNGGYGIPNATVSVFIPLKPEDEDNVVISTLYPYKTDENKNEDGYRYNLLPYVQEYGGHTPTGTFPDREDILTRKEVLEVYEKYYKYTVKTNESGDFMIIGVPLGMQTVILDVDLSNIGCFSLRPSDLIRMGIASSDQVNGTQFKSSTDLLSLPQIINIKKNVDVTSFWGEQDICDIGITRVDFDLRDVGINITPQAIFMGSMFSTSENDFLKSNCKPKKNSGNLCDLVTGYGSILSIRQTINYDINGRPVLEQHILPEGGKIIDENGTWLFNLPMNLEYVTTNEFGEQILSVDPNIGIPTKGKYRFRIKYENEDGMDSSILRADYLVPNIKEWGWNSNSQSPSNLTAQLNSYAFSVDWNDYGDVNTTIGLQMIQEAVNCEDKFYEFNFNKVYTVANFIDRWKWGYNRSRHLGIKEITDSRCTTTTNKFPVNDGVRNFDFIFFLFSLLTIFLTPLFITLIIILHFVALIYPIIRIIINLLIWLINIIVYAICIAITILSFGARPKGGCKKQSITPLSKDNIFKRISLPMMSYPDCESCSCTDQQLVEDSNQTSFAQSANIVISSQNDSILADTNSSLSFNLSNNLLIEGLSGGQNVGNLFKIPFIKNNFNNKFISENVTLSQALNLANLRKRYFEEKNIIKTTVRNTQPNSSSIDESIPFTDNILMLFVDPGTFNAYPPGQLLSFQDITSINDPNLTGLTNPNQFNTNSITGTTPYNTNELVDVPVNYIDPNGNEQTAILKLKITEQEKDYKYPAGVEYFQVITGGTVQQFLGLTNLSTQSLLSTYLFNRTQRFCSFFNPFMTTTTICNTINPLTSMFNYNTHEILFLTKGTDPYTQKQNIRYDLSKLFGHEFETGPVVEGSYYLNIPIQKNTVNPNAAFSPPTWYTSFVTPESHYVNNNSNISLYHKPFGFTVDNLQFSAFTNNSPYYYNSTDASQSDFSVINSQTTLGFFTDEDGVSSDSDTNKIGLTTTINNTLPFQTFVNIPQGNIEGGTLIASNVVGPNQVTAQNEIKIFSPAYHTTTASNIVINDYEKLVFRSDRLPTSDKTEILSNNSFSLFLNDNFSIYKVESGGITLGSTTNGPNDTTNNAQDMADGPNSNVSDTVLSTLACDNMTVLKCYQGGGTNFSVSDPCDENPNGKRMTGGCYIFVDNPLIISIPKDIIYFFEWKTRFRMVFAACRGIFSHVFQNNWVNGTLYMFSIKKQTIFNITGQPKKYKFCGTPNSDSIPYQGPIYYTEGTTNSLFYRSAAYNGTNFVGQEPNKTYGGMNEINLFFPTTIMDLGPKDEYTKEICTNPNFEGYLIESIKSTSYNDTSEILQLFIISRLINSNFWGQVLGLGDASIDRMFSRTADRIDGDVAQMFSINSEYGVEEFDDDNYSDSDLYLSSGDALMGIFFSSNTANRITLSPGTQTFTPTLTNTFNYPKTQLVPIYKWKLDTTSTIFGSDKNNWNTNSSDIEEVKYQDLSFFVNPLSNYFNDLNTGRRGYIYNSDTQGVPTEAFPNGQSDSFLVGAPYHFYFGLNKGKSAINRYIKTYILNQDV